MKHEKFYVLNVISISAVEFCWGLGLPLVIESTFLQLFLRNMGASNLLIGLIPTIFTFCLALLPQFSSYFTANLPKKQTAVVIVHLVPAILLFFIGVVVRGTGNDSSRIALFFVFYSLFAAGIGMVMPVWQNYIVKLFSPEKTVVALSVMLIGQSAAKLITSFVLAGVVTRFAFSPGASSVIFLIAGCILAGSSFFFYLGKEKTTGMSAARQSLFRYIITSAKGVLGNRNFLLYQLSDMETYATVGIISFYAVYATEYCSVSPAVAAGGFLASQYAGGIIVNFTLGWIQRLSLKQKIFFYRCVAIAGIILILIFKSPFVLLLASFFFGFARTGRHLLFPPAVKTLSGSDESTHYFAFAPLLMLPASSLIPLLNGSILDAAERASANAAADITGSGALKFWVMYPGFGYKIVFVIMGVIMLGSLFLLKKAKFEGKPETARVE